MDPRTGAVGLVDTHEKWTKLVKEFRSMESRPPRGLKCILSAKVLKEIYRTKKTDPNFGKHWDKDEDMEIIIENSFLNRDLNYHASASLLADELRYLIEIVVGTADPGHLPLAILEDDGLEYSSIVERYSQLLAEDRGHLLFIYVFGSAREWDKKIWKETLKLLNKKHDNPRGELKVIMDKIDRAINGPDETFRLDEFISREELDSWTIATTINYKTVDVHQQEINFLNNNGNGWTLHTHGESGCRIYCENSENGVNLSEINELAAKCKVLRGEVPDFLSSRKSICSKFVAHEPEPVLLFLGRLVEFKNRKPNMSYKEIYKDSAFMKSLEKGDGQYGDIDKVNDRKQIYKNLVLDNKWETARIFKEIKFWQRIGESPEWKRWNLFVDEVVEQIKKQDKTTNTANIESLRTTNERRAKEFITVMHYASERWKWGTDSSSLVTEVLDKAKNVLNRNKLSLTGVATSQKSRIDFFYTILMDEIDNTHSDVREKSVLKKNKLNLLKKELVVSLDDDTFDRFYTGDIEVIDRTRQNSYKISKVNLENGSGIQLGHIEAGKQTTEENTTLQFSNENNFQDAHDISTTWVTDQLEFVDGVSKTNEDLIDICDDTKLLIEMFGKCFLNYESKEIT